MGNWIPAALHPTIINVTLATAGVEQEVVIDAGEEPIIERIAGIQVKSRSSEDLEMAWESGGDHVTIPAGQTYWKEGMNCHILSLWLTGVSNGQVAEIEYWK